VVLTSPLIRRRFLLLRGLRWLSTGLLIPVTVLLMVDRGFSLGEIGLITAAQGFTVLLLELPTGGLTDTIGRRPVLLVASVFSIGSISLFVVADSVSLLLIVCVLQGIYRALESGPLEAWYVDTAQRVDADADIERGLSHGSVVLGLAISAGSLASGGLVMLGRTGAGPFNAVDPLVLPLLGSLAIELVHLVAVAGLMVEPYRDDRPLASRRRAVLGSLRATPRVVGEAVRLIRRSRVLVALVTVELLWGFGMTAFETFTPPRLADVTGSTDSAASLLGPAQAGAWLLFSAGAFAAPALTRWLGGAYAAGALRVAQGLAVVGIALAAGPVGVIAAFLATMCVHGAANPVHSSLLHRAVEGPTHRATVVSANSLTSQAGGAVGGIALGALADATTLPTAILVGAAVLAAAAPLYLPARRLPQGSLDLPSQPIVSQS
jgi:predicted MFS family arabinose efflux permease